MEVLVDWPSPVAFSHKEVKFHVTAALSKIKLAWSKVHFTPTTVSEYIDALMKPRLDISGPSYLIIYVATQKTNTPYVAVMVELNVTVTYSEIQKYLHPQQVRLFFFFIFAKISKIPVHSQNHFFSWTTKRFIFWTFWN